MKKLTFTLFFIFILASSIIVYAYPKTVSFQIKLLNLTNSAISNVAVSIDTYETLGSDFNQPGSLTYNGHDYTSSTSETLAPMSSATFSGQDDCDIGVGDSENNTSGVGISFGTLKFDFFTCYDDYSGPAKDWSNLETVDGLHVATQSSIDTPVMRGVLNVNTTTSSGECEGYVYKGADPDEGPNASSSQSGCIYGMIVLLPGSVTT